MFKKENGLVVHVINVTLRHFVTITWKLSDVRVALLQKGCKKDKKLAQFDYTLVKAYSDKIVQTSVTVSYCRNLTAFITMDDSSTSANFWIKCKTILCQT